MNVKYRGMAEVMAAYRRLLQMLPKGTRVRITDAYGKNHVWLARGNPVGAEDVRRYVDTTDGASWYISDLGPTLVDIQVLTMPSTRGGTHVFGDSEN